MFIVCHGQPISTEGLPPNRSYCISRLRDYDLVVAHCWPDGLELTPGFYRASQTVLGVYLKRRPTCSRVTSASSALAVLNELGLCALYKSTHSLTHCWSLFQLYPSFIQLGSGLPPAASGPATRAYQFTFGIDSIRFVMPIDSNRFVL